MMLHIGKGKRARFIVLNMVVLLELYNIIGFVSSPFRL
jgi:hypothetical protein